MDSLKSLIPVMLPELILVSVACVLFLVGLSTKAGARRAAPWLTLLSLVACAAILLLSGDKSVSGADAFGSFRVFGFAIYIKLLVCVVGAVLSLLFWPSNTDATGSESIAFGGDAGEFFALLLLSLSGVLMVAGANDMIVLFLGIELASIPTYIMVSVGRPIAVSQEAGVKYFFLGAMAAALMLFGFSYLYGTTGTTNLNDIAALFRGTITSIPGGAVEPTPWQMLALVMLLAGFAFKIAAVPMHAYAGDVYHGAATPITAFLSFVPKTTGIVAIIKLMWVYGGGGFAMPELLCKLLFAVAVLTMTAGNLLGLLQLNVKRVMAYSSIAHSGYMLVGLTALAYARQRVDIQDGALQGVLFYLAAYGVMNVAIFAVLQMLPSRDGRPTTTAETFEDLAGQGRKHVALGLAMAVACFSLIGLPFTIGFFGKLFLVLPALEVARELPQLRGTMAWLIALTMLNAAISAGYYLKIVATLFLRSEPPVFGEARPTPVMPARSLAITLALVLSTAATVGLGVVFPLTQSLTQRLPQDATEVDRLPMVSGTRTAGVASPH